MMRDLKEELKISDLSIGDWVKTRLTDRPYRIKGIFEDEIGSYLVVENLKRERDRCSLSMVAPIPITSEILEKNGFVKNGAYNEWNIGTWETPDLIGVSLERPSIIVKHLGTSIFLDQAKYTQQLQHALRLAGVEKEIKM